MFFNKRDSMKNRRLSGYLMVALAFIFLFLPQNNVFAEKIRNGEAVKKCLNFLTFATIELAEKTSPEKPKLTYIMAKNDVAYDPDDNSCMANILARTIVSQEKSYYGIFYIHYNPYFVKDGVWKPTAKVESYLADWKAFNLEEARARWCQLINLVYFSEASEQGCD